jgi:hypothetical protein
LGLLLSLEAASIRAEFRRSLKAPYRPCHVGIFDLMSEPWPHYVHYYGGGEPFHVSPEHFHFRSHVGPTDCFWIVPGTLERSV